MQNLLDFIFPQLCLGCGQYSDNGNIICETCDRKLDKIKLPYCLHCMSYIEHDIICSNCDSESLPLYSYATYNGPMREIIIQYKFKGITTPAEIFANRIYEQFGQLITQHQADYLIPIPLYKSRESERGYNQALLLAKQLAKDTQIEVFDSLLYRIKKRKPQAKLSIPERKKNIESVFEVDDILEDSKNCILIDDVVTTGNTVFEATKVLEHNGYKVVAVISIAHAF